MKDTLEEAKLALAKAKDDMARYYNCCRSPAPSFSPSDMVYLDSEDIQTTRPSKKLSHCCLGPYPVEIRIRKYAYHLVLPPLMRRLHPVFNVMKLSPAPDDPIVGTRHDCKGKPSRFPFRFHFHFHFHFRLPLLAHPLTLHLPPLTRHCFRPASR